MVYLDWFRIGSLVWKVDILKVEPNFVPTSVTYTHLVEEVGIVPVRLKEYVPEPLVV